MRITTPMRRALIVAAMACSAMAVVGTTLAAGADPPAPRPTPLSPAIIAKHGLTGYPANVIDALARAYETTEAPTVFYRSAGGRYG
jgi:hypothetical protein